MAFKQAQICVSNLAIPIVLRHARTLDMLWRSAMTWIIVINKYV